MSSLSDRTGGVFPLYEAAPWRVLDAFVQQLPQCVCVYSLDGRCLVANERFCRWLGRDEDEVIGQALVTLWPADFAAREQADLRLVLESGRIDQQEVRPGPSGPRPVRASKFPCHGPAGELVGVTVLFDELTRSLEAVSRAEAVGRLAMGIVHDINNSLTLLRVHFSQIEHHVSWGLLAGAQRVLDHACQLPRQLLAFIRNDAPRREPVDVNVLIMTLADLLRPRVQGRIAFEQELQPGGAWVEGDPVQLTQALLNLASNSIDAMSGEGRLAFTTERVNLEPGDTGPGGPCVRVTVRDTGPGISPELQGRLFTPLATTRAGGTGLGLMVVQTVLQEHGGWIGWRSAPGQGACFVIHLPATQAPPATIQPVGPRESWRVLVIERDNDIRRLTGMILEHSGAFVSLLWPDIPSALDAVSLRFDLILLDTDNMDRDGWEALAQLLARVPGAGLLLLSTHRDPPVPASVLPRFRGIITKPFGAELLLNLVRGALEEQADALV